MAKQGGLGDGLLIDQYDVSGDFASVATRGGPALKECTGLDKQAMERMALIRDGGIEGNTFFNKAAGQEHAALSPLPLADRIITYQRGRLLGSPAASLVAKQGNYDPQRDDDGSLACAVEAPSNGYGLAWGVQHTPGRRTDTTATNGAAVDAGASSAFGLAAFLHVIAFTGTSVTIKLQESSDNGGADAWADVTGGAFTLVTAVGKQRIQTGLTLTVERYLRVVTSGTFTNVNFLVNVARHEIATAY